VSAALAALFFGEDLKQNELGLKARSGRVEHSWPQCEGAHPLQTTHGVGRPQAYL